MRYFNIILASLLSITNCGQNNTENNLKNSFQGIWETEIEPYVILDNGDWKVEDNIWNYRFKSDSMIEIFNSPFDDYNGPKGMYVLFCDGKTLILYDEMFHDTLFFRKKTSSP